MKEGLFLAFVLLLALILVVFYVGTASLLLTGAKAGQQVGYFLTGRTATGAYRGGQ
jgi:hypothetical protein